MRIDCLDLYSICEAYLDHGEDGINDVQIRQFQFSDGKKVFEVWFLLMTRFGKKTHSKVCGPT